MAEPAASAVLLTAAPVALMTEPVAETTEALVEEPVPTVEMAAHVGETPPPGPAGT